MNKSAVWDRIKLWFQQIHFSMFLFEFSQTLSLCRRHLHEKNSLYIFNVMIFFIMGLPNNSFILAHIFKL